MKKQKDVMLNIGCGSVHHEAWINLDLVSRSPSVIACNILEGLPFAAASADVCYSSHVLEHLKKEGADQFLQEQKRVLKRQGILRIVIPDLETICRNYLKYLDEASSGNVESEFKYDYSLLELLDQTARSENGGDLAKLWTSGTLASEDLAFVEERHGLEALNAIAYAQASQPQNRFSLAKAKRLLSKEGVHKVSAKGRLLLEGTVIRGLLGGKSWDAFREGKFRRSGEIHQVMYDRFSLKRLLEAHGYTDIKLCTAYESQIPNFSAYGMDTVKGVVRKPDSLFMEARNP